jgi:hypothetical protein
MHPHVEKPMHPNQKEINTVRRDMNGFAQTNECRDVEGINGG